MAFFNNPQYNLLSHRLIRFLYWQFNKKDVNEFRRSIGLATLKRSVFDKISSERILNLYAFSPGLLSRPMDWDSNTDITGFLTLPPRKRETHAIDQTPDGLQEWLNKGEKPVYIGFGSIPVPDPELFTKILHELIYQAGLRVIFCSGWSDIRDLPDHPNLFIVKYVNHEWLFPQCKVAVIHGGVGTVAATLRAKIPPVIVSVFGDQPWWGKLIEQKKLGIHLPFKKLTTLRLAKSIEKAQTPAIQKNALEMGEQINKEDGLKKAMEAIEHYFAGS